MKHGSTLILKAVIGLMGMAVLLVCVLAFPALVKGNLDQYAPILVGLYLSAIPFFAALYMAFSLLRYIDTNKAFSQAAVNISRNIKYCAIAIGVIYAVGLPYVYIVADQDDAPGVLALGIVFTFAAFVIAVAAAVFQRLLQHAVAIKTENDLTV